MLLSLVPWYIRLGIMVALVVASMAFGAVEGIKYEQGVVAVRDAKKAEQVRTIVKTVNVETTKIEKVYVDRAKKRDADREKANVELVDHAKLPDPESCWLAPERVRSINDAWGIGSGSDTGAGPVGVRVPDSVKDGKPSGSGAVGEGAGGSVQGVRRPPERAGGEGSPETTSGGTSR